MRELTQGARIFCIISLVIASVSFGIWQDSIWAGIFFISAITAIEGIIH